METSSPWGKIEDEEGKKNTKNWMLQLRDEQLAFLGYKSRHQLIKWWMKFNRGIKRCTRERRSDLTFTKTDPNNYDSEAKSSHSSFISPSEQPLARGQPPLHWTLTSTQPSGPGYNQLMENSVRDTDLGRHRVLLPPTNPVLLHHTV